MFLKTVWSKLEITAKERLTNTEWWWEQVEKESLALEIRCRQYLSLLVLILFMRCGWKLTINHFLSLPKTLHNCPFFTLENKYFFFFFFSTYIYTYFRLNSHTSEKQFSTPDNLVWSKKKYFKHFWNALTCDQIIRPVSCYCIHKTQESSVSSKLQRFPEQVSSLD